MKELEYTHHEDVALQHLIDEEKPIYDKYRKKFRELAEEFYDEIHKKEKEIFGVLIIVMFVLLNFLVLMKKKHINVAENI